MSFLEGKKTKLSALGLVLGGLAMIVRAFGDEAGVDVDMILDGIVLICGAGAAFGLWDQRNRNVGGPS
jgi:hypothetical protein